MNSIALALLALGVGLAAVISALFGLAGGTIVFVLLSWTLDAKQAVPLHAAVQVVGNLSRFGVFWQHIQWRVVGLFSILLVPGACLGALFYQWFNPDLISLLVGVFILLSLFLPEKKPQNSPNWVIVGIGFLSSFLGMIVAVTGPFIASFFVLKQLSKEDLVATKSVCQAMTQIVKTLVFSVSVGFQFGDYGYLLVILGIATILGTFIGKFLLAKLSEQHYDVLNRGLLGLIGSLMMAGVLWKWVQ
jgi:uncharacterized membrane protein YfcA